MKRNIPDPPGTALHRRPLKKQKLRSNQVLPTSSVHESTHEAKVATPLRGESSNIHWVTPRVQATQRDHVSDEAFGSLATPKNQESTPKDSPIKISPIQEQKENLPHTFPSPGVSSKEKNRKELKAILQRNGQNVTGTVQVLQNRVADGEARGKLGICPKCGGGKLKIEDKNPHVVYCSRKLLCCFRCHTHAAPRCGPWTCVSFDDDQDDSPTTSNASAPASIANSGSSSPGNAAAAAKVGYAPEKNTPIRPRPQMPTSHGPNTMYHGYPGYSSPSPLYWNDQRGPPHPPSAQQHARSQVPRTFYYPRPHSFPQHHPRQPFYPMQMGYLPMSPHGAPSVFRHPENVRYNGEQQRNRESVAADRPWFPLSDPAYFPDRGSPCPQRPPDESERARNDQEHQTNPGACNYTPAQVAMATKAAKKVLGSSKQADGAKHVWSAEEDEIVRNAVTATRVHNFNAWSSLAPFLPGRTGKQIRDRWINHLNPHLIHTPFDRDEDLLLWNAFVKFGKSWKEISIRHFHSRRSENKIKNRWHSSAYQRFIANRVGAKEYERALSRSEE